MKWRGVGTDPYLPPAAACLSVVKLELSSSSSQVYFNHQYHDLPPTNTASDVHRSFSQHHRKELDFTTAVNII